MRAYLAGPYAARAKLARYAEVLREHGVEVTSTWLEETTEINQHTLGAATGLADETVDGHARMDLADIDRSDVLVAFTVKFLLLTPEQAGSGGRHVETGYALAQQRKVIVVGEPENVFHRLSSVERYADWDQLVHRLVAMVEVEADLLERGRFPVYPGERPMGVKS